MGVPAAQDGPGGRGDRCGRRDFGRAVAAGTLAGILGAARTRPARGAGGPRPAAISFASQVRIGLIDPDGGGPRFLTLDRPGQATWQVAGVLGDSGRLLLLSMEPRRDGPGRPFETYYTQTPTHLWAYDPAGERLEELVADRRELAPFVTPALVLGDDRLLVQVVRQGVGQVVSVGHDGSDPRPFTKPGEGLPYGLSLSPDGRRVAFHLASPQGYQVWTADRDGGDRVRLAADAGHLYFGTSWSPDGRWVLFVDCRDGQDPGHDWADVCIARADGTELRRLTEGQAMWFAATYGPPGNRGGGSNVPAWALDGAIVFPRRLPGSRVPWAYQADRPDVDHFNREYRPEAAVGGTEIVRLDPADGRSRALTAPGPGVWDFRAAVAPDGRRVAFCRAPTGEPPGLWVMAADGSGPRRLTRGLDDRGVDHPRWL